MISTMCRGFPSPVKKFFPFILGAGKYTKINLNPFESSRFTGIMKLHNPHSQKSDSNLFFAKEVKQIKNNRFSFPIFSNEATPHNVWLIFLILSALGITYTFDQANALEAQAERIEALLKKDPEKRTIDEQIEVFNSLLKLGEEEAKKAKNKDVVIVFGNTGAGKSTLINFLHGCQMMKDEKGNIVVHPQSKIKEVASIGLEPDSHTYVPQKMPDVIVTIPKEFQTSGDNVRPLTEPYKLIIYDTPGLNDNRGIEVAIANVISIKQINENARSVKFVMVSEQNELSALKGDHWKRSVKLLQESFHDTLGRGESSLCLIITKTKDDLDAIKENIRSYFLTKHTPIDLSQYAITYDPLNPKERDQLLGTIYATRAYKGLNTKISMGEDQLWRAKELGKKIQGEVEEHLKKGKSEIPAAVKKIEFTYGIAKLGNEGLKEPHQEASKAVYEPVDRILKEIDPRRNQVLKNQIEAYKDYKYYKNNFSPYINFQDKDTDVNLMIHHTNDPRWADWGTFETTAGFFVTTIACTIGGIFYPPLWAGSAGGGLATMKSICHWWSPSDEDLFFRGQ